MKALEGEHSTLKKLIKFTSVNSENFKVMANIS